MYAVLLDPIVGNSQASALAIFCFDFTHQNMSTNGPPPAYSEGTSQLTDICIWRFL